MSNERRKSQRHELRSYLTVYEMESGHPIGKLVNVSSEGAMFATVKPVRENTTFQCRVKLPLSIMERDEILFSAKCRWSRKNVTAGRWESGYQLSFAEEEAVLLPYLTLGFELSNWGDKDLPEVRTVALENRRRGQRYDFDKPLPVFEVDSYRQIGELLDLSMEGARLIGRHRWERHDRVALRVRLPRTIAGQEYLHLKAECMWIRDRGGRYRYESGHQIEAASKSDTAILMNLLIHSGQEQSARRTTRVMV